VFLIVNNHLLGTILAVNLFPKLYLGFKPGGYLKVKTIIWKGLLLLLFGGLKAGGALHLLGPGGRSQEE